MVAYFLALPTVRTFIASLFDRDGSAVRRPRQLRHALHPAFHAGDLPQQPDVDRLRQRRLTVMLRAGHRDACRSQPLRASGQGDRLHADGDFARRRRHHLEVRLRRARCERSADRPAQRHRRWRSAASRRRGSPSSSRGTTSSSSSSCLDADRLRHGALLGGDQGGIARILEAARVDGAASCASSSRSSSPRSRPRSSP